MPVGFKKKNQVKSPSPESRVPETGSDSPIGSDRESGRDSALDAFIYRFSNDGMHLKAEILDPQKLWPNWLLYRDIENYVVT